MKFILHLIVTLKRIRLNITFIGTQETPFSNFEENLRNRYSLKLQHDDINAKIMNLKALFMDEIYTF